MLVAIVIIMQTFLPPCGMTDFPFIGQYRWTWYLGTEFSVVVIFDVLRKHLEGLKGF